VLATDPENSVFFDAWLTGNASLTLECGSRIEGIGRARVERSFVPGVIDAMMKVPDALSIGAIHYLERVLGRRCGGSTGTNLIGAMALAHVMQVRGERGSIVLILCDGGDRYRGTYYDVTWLSAHGFDIDTAMATLTACAEHGAPLPIELMPVERTA
jgi:cysteine synthase A